MTQDVGGTGGTGSIVAGGAPLPGWPVLLAVCTALGLATLSSTIVNVALPSIGTSLGGGLSDLQWVANAYTLVYASLLPAAGPVGDRLGRRRLFTAGLAVFSVGALACALAPNLPALVVLRLVQATGGAAITPVGLAIIASEFPDPSVRARAVGVWAGVASLGLAAGPVVGGVLIAHGAWRSVFWLVGLVGLVAAPLAWRLIPPTADGHPEYVAPLDPGGVVLAAGFLAGLSFGLIQGQVDGWTSGSILASFGLSTGCLTGFLVLEAHRGRRALMPLSVWRSPPFIAANLGGAVYFLSLFGILFFFSLYLQEVGGDSPLRTGLIFFPLTAVMAVLAPLAGRAVALLGVRLVVVVGFLIAAAGTTSLALLPAAAGAGGLVWRFVITGAGFGLMSAPLTAAAVGSLPRSSGGLASSVYNTFRQVGAVLGVALLGAVLTARQHSAHLAPPAAFLAGLHAAMSVATGCLLGCAVACALLLRPQAPT